MEHRVTSLSARVVFEIFKSSNMGSTPDMTVTNVPVDSNGDAVSFLRCGG